MNTKYIPLAVLALALSLGGCNTPNRPSPTPPPPKKTEKEGQNANKGNPPIKDSIPTDATPKDSIPTDTIPKDSVPTEPFPTDSTPTDSATIKQERLSFKERLLAFGNDGLISDLPYTTNDTDPTEVLMAQKEALQEMLAPNAVVDYGRPAYAIAHTPTYNMYSGIDETEGEKGGFFFASFFAQYYDEPQYLGDNTPKEKAKQYRLGLVDKNGNLVACSQTYYAPQKEEISGVIPILLDVPEGRYHLQLFMKDPLSEEIRWNKIYWCRLWEHPDIWANKRARELEPNIASEQIYNRVMPQRFNNWTPEEEYLTVKDFSKAPKLGDYTRILRDPQENLMKFEYGSVYDDAYTFSDLKASTCTLVLRNTSNSTIKGKVFIKQAFMVHKGFPTKVLGTSYNHYDRISDFYEVEIPPHKELHRVLEFNVKALNPTGKSRHWEPRNKEFVHFCFIPDGSNETNAILLPPDHALYFRLLKNTPNTKFITYETRKAIEQSPIPIYNAIKSWSEKGVEYPLQYTHNPERRFFW